VCASVFCDSATATAQTGLIQLG